MTWRRLSVVGPALLLLLARAQAAEVRPFVEVTRSDVRLSDLFTGLLPGQDCRLGDAPAPGQRVTIEEDQLAAIADQFGVDWNTGHGWRSVTLERPGRLIDADLVLATLIPALRSAGMPTSDTPSLKGWAPVELDRDTTVGVRDTVFNQASGQYEAELITLSKAGEQRSWRLNGAADVMIRVLATSHNIAAGAIISGSDIVEREIRQRDASLSIATDPQTVVGTVARHPLVGGRPIILADIEQPEIVRRGSTVLMHLDGQGLELAMQGEALDGGAMGTRVRVRNLSSGAVLLAIISGAGEVSVDPSSPPQIYNVGSNPPFRDDALTAFPPPSYPATSP